MANMQSVCGCQYCFKNLPHPPGCMVLHQGARSIKVSPSLMKGFIKIRRTNAFKSTCTTKSSNLPRSEKVGGVTLEQANQIYQDRPAKELQDFFNRTNSQIFDGKLLGDLFTVWNMDGDGSCFYRAASITSTTTDRFGTIANIRFKLLIICCCKETYCRNSITIAMSIGENMLRMFALTMSGPTMFPSKDLWKYTMLLSLLS